jgi:predicted aminopeptidase
MYIINNKHSISELVSAPETNSDLKQQLTTIQEILDFAYTWLQLPDQGSYRHYSDTGRDYVVWNVFAAPVLSMDPKQWCYFIVGCMSYRGYFNKNDAEQYANELADSGWEVYVGGVTAYSTLGWFEDPVLNTMLNREDWELARLLFHELAHQKLYIKDDTEFNEAFADSVAIIGLEKWLDSRQLAEKQRIRTLLENENRFIELVLYTRQKLIDLYRSETDEVSLLQKKNDEIQRFQEQLRYLQGNWEDASRYQTWLTRPVNNARLSAVSTYRTLVPRFLDVFERSNKDLVYFYTVIQAISECPKADRYRLLEDPPEPNECLPMQQTAQE